MAAVPYERYTDEIEDTEQRSVSSEEDVAEPTPRPDVIIKPYRTRYQEIFRDRWPKGIGILQIIIGVCIEALGIVQVFILPFVLNHTPFSPKLERSSLWGIGLWAGLILIITGLCGLRAAVSKSVSTVYVFFGFILVDIVLFFACIVLILIGYSNGWTLPDAYDQKPLFYVHLANSILIPLGSFILTVAFTQYYEDVLCGELQCLRRALHCCLPCWCPRVVEPEELMSEDGRPPVLPI